MKKKISILLILIIIVAAVIAACDNKAEEAFNETSPDKASDSPARNGQVSGYSKNPNEHIAVIVDTVVDVFRKPDIKSERITQAIFNQPVAVLEEEGVWIKVKTADGCTGWIKSRFADTDCYSITAEDYNFRVVVTGKSKRVLSQPQGGITIKEVVMGTEFYSSKKMEGAYQVALPGRVIGWISETGTIELPVQKHIPQTSAEDFVATALKLKGTSYLLGGISTWGIDCSGLTYISARINGVDLPRSANEQFRAGSMVSKKLINRGDLVYFSREPGSDDISDIGIALGDGNFLYASKSKGYVTISSLDEPFFKDRLIGVKRLF